MMEGMRFCALYAGLIASALCAAILLGLCVVAGPWWWPAPMLLSLAPIYAAFEFGIAILDEG